MKIVTENRKAFFDYFIEDKYEAGIVLAGSEIKSIRGGKVNLKDSYVIIRNGEAFVVGMHISAYEKTTMSLDVLDPLRTRKLLFGKTEIEKLEKKSKVKGFTIIPLNIHLNDRGIAKMDVAIAKGKQLFNKKESLKERDIKRETERELKRNSKA